MYLITCFFSVKLNARWYSGYSEVGHVPLDVRND
jgi:hypothetical protein